MRLRRCSGKFRVERAKPRLDLGQRPGLQIHSLSFGVLHSHFRPNPGLAQ